MGRNGVNIRGGEGGKGKKKKKVREGPRAGPAGLPGGINFFRDFGAGSSKPEGGEPWGMRWDNWLKISAHFGAGGPIFRWTGERNFEGGGLMGG